MAEIDVDEIAEKHISQRYFDKHGHFPRVVVVSGVQRITVEFAPGYVRIATSSPYQAQVYITRSAFKTLLVKLVPLAKRWGRDPAKDHDVPKAMREAYFQEVRLLEEKRALKRARPVGSEEVAAREKQRRRFLRARARAVAARAEEED